MIKNKLLCQYEKNCVIMKKRENLTIYIDELYVFSDRKEVKIWNCSYGKKF